MKKGLTGWKFDRREFLAATAAAAAAATAAVMGSINRSEEKSLKTPEVSSDSITLAMTMLTMMAVKSGGNTWIP